MKIKFVTLNIWEGGKSFDSVVSFIKKEDPDIVAFQEVRNGNDLKFERRFRTFDVFKDELTTTFNMKRKDENGYSTAVVDMIFVSPNIKILERFCPKVDISDHLPLVCSLEI